MTVSHNNPSSSSGAETLKGVEALPASAQDAKRDPAHDYFVYIPIVQTSPHMTLAVIGDFGLAGPYEAAVAALVKGWNPNIIVTVGDNNYPSGASSTIDKNIGQYYSDYIYPYSGSYTRTSTLTANRFFPALGNHDWMTSDAAPHRSYFTLPSNERYYDLTVGQLHLFILDSDSHEPDGKTSKSVQALWLQTRMAASTACWQLVFFHHAAYSSSSTHGSTAEMQWPFQAWGADAVLAGHDHTYERLQVGGLPYFVNGLGGADIYSFGTPIAGSQVRYNAKHGAMRITASGDTLTFEFINVNGQLIDTYTLHGSCAVTLNR